MERIFINPGSGTIAFGSKEQSEINIKQFILDTKLPYKFKFESEGDDGRHSYKIWDENSEHTIAMPALPLEQVRYTDAPNQKIFHFPRLFIDFSSFVWKYAVEICIEEYKKKD